jgi:hypothetical protein
MNRSRRLTSWLPLLLLLVGRAALAQPFELPVRLVKDINPGAAGPLAMLPIPPANVNGTLFFAADDGTTGLELPRRAARSPLRRGGSKRTTGTAEGFPETASCAR